MPLISNGPPEEEGFRAGLVVGPDGKTTGDIVCYPSFDPNCTVVVKPSKSDIDATGFISLGDPTGYHDHNLMKATAKINEILTEAFDSHDVKDGNLHVVSLPSGPMLAWVKTTALDAKDIRKESSTHIHG